MQTDIPLMQIPFSVQTDTGVLLLFEVALVVHILYVEVVLF